MKVKLPLSAISVVVLTPMFVLAAVQISGSGQDARSLNSEQWQHGKAGRIEGTWRVESTLRDCQTGAALATAPILNTFLAGGSMLSQASTSPALLSPGHGVWNHVGGRRFTNTVVLFQFNPANGMYAGTVTVKRNIDLDWNSDEFTSTDVGEAADPNGNVIGKRCATSAGRRLE